VNNAGCNFLEFGINFELDTVCDCCISHNDGRGLPILLENYHGEQIDWENLFNTKSKRIECQKQQTIQDCLGCYHLNEYSFTNERKISEFHFSHCRLCNAKCIYCSDTYSGGTQNYNTYPIIKDLIEKGYYKAGGEATFQGGEPTLMQNFDELVDLFISNGTNVRIHTSAIKYSKTVENALKNNFGSVVISLDSGSKSTYKKIKQVDKFDKVCESIKNYSNARNLSREGNCQSSTTDNVIIKYIIIPGINDNLKEIDKFFKLMKKLKIKTVALDLEVQYARKYNNQDVSQHIFLLVDYFQNQAEKYNIKVLIYSFISYVIQKRVINKLKFPQSKLLTAFSVFKNNDKSKNIDYKR
jgi:molybdenum cofactor biosynthesis enzyme MoaA